MHDLDDEPRDAPTGLPDDDNEAPPLGAPETDPDGEAPAPDELPGLPDPGVEPDTAG